jgi:eukaryotic-like serine/threonine-protein kinase
VASRPETEQGGSAGTVGGTAVGHTSTPPPGDTRPVSTSTDPLAGRVLSHYRLDERLGAGGMGTLYRATDLKLGRAVAIKFLARHLVSDETAKARFVREARAASALDHPNIANVYEIGEEDGELFIAMALYEGETLKQRLEKGRLGVEEALDVLRQVSLGLEAAHRAGIVHRDIKPANILITNTGIVKILDFGLAKLVSDSQAQTMTQAGQAMGTVLYMSPEQLRGESVDTRADLWSFGVLAYEVLAGVSPFQTDSSAATVARIVHEEPPSLATVPGVPDWLAELVSQLLRKNPAERPQTASDVLQRLQDGNPTGPPAAPIPAIARRSRLPWRTSLIFVAGLLLASPAWWVLRSRVSRQNIDADRSIAVLPFANLSPGEENAYFVQGFHDELLRQIASIGDLRVISRTSVLQYKDGARNLREIADGLGVSSIVEGSVQRAGNRIRVEARLIDARDDRHVWADRYDRDVTDIFAIQTAVAQEIAGALHARLSAAQIAKIARKPTQNTEAYDRYLRGLDYLNRPGVQPENLAIAIGFFRNAVDMDGSFALARAKLAYAVLARFFFFRGTRDEAEVGGEEAKQSLKLQPDLPEGHLALGYYHYYGHLDYRPALQEFEIARQAIPAEATAAIAYVLRRQGKFEESLRALETVARLDPRSADVPANIATLLSLLRRYEEAESKVDRALGIAPDLDSAVILKAWIRAAWKGETEPGKEVLRQLRGRINEGRLGFGGSVVPLLEMNPREALTIADSLGPDSRVAAVDYPKAFLRAVAHECIGELARALEEYATVLPAVQAAVEKRPDDPFLRVLLARAYAALGRKQDALDAMDRAQELLPLATDRFSGLSIVVERAKVEARVGDIDAAIGHIRELLTSPSPLSPALLRVNPTWAPLRNDPRFRKLAELE